MSGVTPAIPPKTNQEVAPELFTLKDFYEAIRKQIEHEDSLCNHRMTWFIALNAFLFSGYGFSLGAESGPNGALMKSTLENARDAMAALGILTSIATVVSLGAAQLSIYRLVTRWYSHAGKNEKIFPQIIGNHSPSRTFGTAMGAVPLYFIPLLCLSTWLSLKFQLSLVPMYVVGSLILMLASVRLGMVLERQLIADQSTTQPPPLPLPLSSPSPTSKTQGVARAIASKVTSAFKLSNPSDSP